VLALDGGEDKIGGGLDRARLASFAGLHFELAASALTNERLARVARPLTLAATGASSRPSSAFTGVSPGPAGARWACIAPPCRVLECGEPADMPVPPPPEPQASEPSPSGAALRWRWRSASDGNDPHGGEGEVLTRFGGARVAERPGGTVARVWLGADPRAAHFVMSGLASLLLHRRGGALLHSASVALDDRVFAFVGPSGAGKSTACRHVAGAELFSVDRLAVLPVPARAGAPGSGLSGSGAASGAVPAMWLAHPLSGGTRSTADLPSAPDGWLPLAGVLRMQRGAPVPPPEGARIRDAAGAIAVATLRESAFQLGSGASAEAELLGTLEALTRSVPVARLELTLGASLAPALRRWLVDQAKDRT
jgi:hypothetical protein